MLVATRLAIAHLGTGGVYGLAAIAGVTDVDPFIMSMTQAAGTFTHLQVAAASVLIAAASNNLVKGVYARFFAGRETGAESFWLLAGLGVLGLAPLFWLL
jgi:uncharacterized membrane protein (DUF4010 family)